MRRHGWAILGAVLLSTAARAADTHLSADVNAGVGWANNPFAVRGSNWDGGSGYYQVGIRPRLSINGPLTQAAITGHAQFQDYFTDYSNSDSYGADATVSHQATERLSVNARLGYDNSIIGTNELGLGDPDAPLPPNGEDLGLFGNRDRRRTYTAGAGFTYQPSARDSITGSGFYTASRYGSNAALGNYDSYGGTLAYQRQVTERLSLGAQGSYMRSVYDGPQGATNIYTAQGTFGLKLNDQWTVDGALGASFVNRQITGGTSTSLSGNISVCRQGERDQECLTASRQVMPTGFAGTQNQTNVTLRGDYKLTERTSLNGSLGYTDIGGQTLVPGLIHRYFRADAGLSHRLTERLSLRPSAFFRDFGGRGVSVRSDYGGRIGLSYRLGDMR